MIPTWLRIVALASAVAASGVTPVLAQAKKTLTISWWGFNGDKLEEYLLKPFRAECNCDIVFETGNNADRLNKIKIRGGAGVDLVYLTDSFSDIGIKEGLFQKIDRSKIPNLAGIYDIAKAPQGDYGPAYTLGRYGIIYDGAKVKPPITAWKDLWRPEFKKSLSLPGISTTAGPMTVILAGQYAGTDAFKDAEPAFKAIEQLKGSVVKNYNTGSELVNLFSTGEITVSAAQDFVLAQIQKAVPTAVWADLSDGAVATLNTINIAKGAKEVELSYRFIDFLLRPDIQQKLAENGVDAPVVKSVTLTPEQAKQWTYGAAMVGSLKTIDMARMNAAKADWTDRWQEIFGK
jgi:putative spermidine/putrescine transport system substrate-binding protein